MVNATSSEDYSTLKAELRSLLISSQQGCTEVQLIKDYKAFNGREIPFLEMGYNSLIELLRSMPDVARCDRSRMPMVIHGVADQNTAHIKELVMRQKKSKNKSVRGGNQRNYSSRAFGSPYYSPVGQSPRPSNPRYNSSNVMNNNIRSTKNPRDQHEFNSKPHNTQPNQNIWIHPVTNRDQTKMAQSKSVASFPPRATPTPFLPMAEGPTLPDSNQMASPIDDDFSCNGDDPGFSAEEELAAYDVERAKEYGEQIVHLRKQMRQLLLKFPTGLWLKNVALLYKKTFNQDLNLKDFNLKTLMALFDCVSDFIDSRRDPRSDSTDRIFMLKPQFTDAVKREQLIMEQGRAASNQPSIDKTFNKPVLKDMDRPLVDLSSFVLLDFRYETKPWQVGDVFNGFWGEIISPLNMQIGNVEFIPARDQMMNRLQDFYSQQSDQGIYDIPFEQISIDLCCIYYHNDDGIYYRSSIIEMNPIPNGDIIQLKLYLVDFGYIIPNINYHLNSRNIKFLHKEFSILPIEIFTCVLANVDCPHASHRWDDDVNQFMTEALEGTPFRVKVLGVSNEAYIIDLHTDQYSLNELLVQQGFAIKTDNYNDSTLQSASMVLPNDTNCIESGDQENSIKRYTVSIDHVYCFVKHPFSKRPCLPCFELARLLRQDEAHISGLNLIRETIIPLEESNWQLFHDLRCLQEASKCSHIHQVDTNATVLLYDLSSIRDHLCKIKYTDGDVIDAFGQEYDNFERDGYWNETESRYGNQDDVQSQRKTSLERKDMLDFRKQQLLSMSQINPNHSSQNELEKVDKDLDDTIGRLHTLGIRPPIIDSPTSHLVSLRNGSKASKSKMRETLYRIARPIDQQFSLCVCFHHELLNHESLQKFEDENDLEECFRDLYRITKNVIEFFILEAELLDENGQSIINELHHILGDLIESRVDLQQRIETYNHCLRCVECFQPIIRSNLLRTDLFDIIY